MSTAKKITTIATRQWVKVKDIQFPPTAQRERINWAHVGRIAANLDPDKLGHPSVCERDGVHYAYDGMHRVKALEQAGYGDQLIECDVRQGMTDEEMAEAFLVLNDNLKVGAFDKFRVGLTAQRSEETEIDLAVRSQGLRVSQQKTGGTISAVGTLRKVYARSGYSTLTRALRIIRDAFGDAGFDARVIDGIALLCQRYGREMDDDKAVAKLRAVRAQHVGLLASSEVLHAQHRKPRNHCVAAAAVKYYNAGRGGAKLADWFATE